MRIALDFGNGDGPIDYSAALAGATPGRDSNTQTSVEPFAIDRERGAPVRCRATMDAAACGLEPPVEGCRVLVESDTGVTLFLGRISEAPRRIPGPWGAQSPVLFHALEDAAFTAAAAAAGLQPAGAVTHAVHWGDDALEVHGDGVDGRAEDLLVLGGDEASAYVTELFRGDGTTAAFELTARPWTPAGSGALLEDNFTGGTLDPGSWRVVDAGQHLAPGSGGLRMAGGNGLDGQTVLAARLEPEMAGTLCAEMRGLVLQPGSGGVLLGMYRGPISLQTCFAGVRVRAQGGAQALAAVVNGAEVGTAVPWQQGHSYTLRLRLHCAEAQRVRQSYQALVNGAVQTWGGGLVEAPMQVVVEVLDEGLSSSVPATVLYAGSVSVSPARAVFAPVNSLSLAGSLAGIGLHVQSSAWVTTTEADGSVTPRRPGAPETGEDYQMRGKTLLFSSGRVPAAGSLVTVRYRQGRRAQARLQCREALERMQQMGLPGLRQGSRRVIDPEPRSAADCAAAARALLSLYADPAFGLRGTCRRRTSTASADDVKPGDALALPLAATPVLVSVHAVTIASGHSVPETLDYRVGFELTEANGLSFGTEATGEAADGAEMYMESSVAGLPNLSVMAAGPQALQLDAGTAPPVGGGFEVRRHDGGWGPDGPAAAADGELVLRSPVRQFSVPRLAFAERFYVRMFDGAETPAYSAQSALLCTHLPLS